MSVDDQGSGSIYELEGRVCERTEADNRTTENKFKWVACVHLDLNTAANILASRIGATARREALALVTR